MFLTMILDILLNDNELKKVYVLSIGIIVNFETESLFSLNVICFHSLHKNMTDMCDMLTFHVYVIAILFKKEN